MYPKKWREQSCCSYPLSGCVSNGPDADYKQKMANELQNLPSAPAMEVNLLKIGAIPKSLKHVFPFLTPIARSSKENSSMRKSEALSHVNPRWLVLCMTALFCLILQT